MSKLNDLLRRASEDDEESLRALARCLHRAGYMDSDAGECEAEALVRLTGRFLYDGNLTHAAFILWTDREARQIPIDAGVCSRMSPHLTRAALGEVTS